MAELHVISALRDKRSELAGTVRQLEQQLAQQRSNLAHVDATLLLFDPEIRPSSIRPRQERQRNAWFRPGECLRLIYDELRDEKQPVSTRELTERIIRSKTMTAADQRSRDLIQRTILSSLSRSRKTIARSQANGVVCWRLV